MSYQNLSFFNPWPVGFLERIYLLVWSVCFDNSIIKLSYPSECIIILTVISTDISISWIFYLNFFMKLNVTLLSHKSQSADPLFGWNPLRTYITALAHYFVKFLSKYTRCRSQTRHYFRFGSESDDIYYRSCGLIFFYFPLSFRKITIFVVGVNDTIAMQPNDFNCFIPHIFEHQSNDFNWICSALLKPNWVQKNFWE